MPAPSTLKVNVVLSPRAKWELSALAKKYGWTRSKVVRVLIQQGAKHAKLVYRKPIGRPRRSGTVPEV